METLHLHFEPHTICKWGFFSVSLLTRMASLLFNQWPICILLLPQMQLGTLACGKQAFACPAAVKRQMAMHSGYLLHLVITSAFWTLRKLQMVFFGAQSSQAGKPIGSIQWQICILQFSENATLDCGSRSSACLAASKKQLSLNTDNFLHVDIATCILSCPQYANEVSFPFSHLDAWQHFCLTSDLSACRHCHKMQLGTLACGKQSFACLAAVKKQMAMQNGYLLHLYSHSICILNTSQTANGFFGAQSSQPGKPIGSIEWQICILQFSENATLDCGTRSFACKAEKIAVTEYGQLSACGHCHLHFEPPARCKWRFFSV